MEDRYCRDSSDPITAQLSKLVTAGTVNIDESVHVADTELLNMGLRIQLPLGTQTKQESVRNL
jgi:hypothetical protein